jgi:hypothetical protein
MFKTAVLLMEAAIVVGVVAYFAIEGFSGNVAVTVVLSVLALASIAILVGTLIERRPPQ